MKVVIFAANGYMGKVLVRYFRDQYAEVVAVTRTPFSFGNNITNAIWDGKTYKAEWGQYLNRADLVVNLAGKSVNCRYNEKNKKEIFDSRTFATLAVAEAINKCDTPPLLWVNAASATIYRHAEDRPMDEDTGEIGEGFSVEVCKKWEKTFFETSTPGTRKAALRTAIVFGKEDGVFVRLQNLVRYGLGGKQGNGKQMFSWIHENDFCRMLDFLLQNKDLEGVFNAAAPGPVSNAEMMKTIRQETNTPIGLPASVWLLEIGAILIGTETELILKSRWVIPGRLEKAGFKFKFPQIREAVKEIVNS